MIEVSQSSVDTACSDLTNIILSAAKISLRQKKPIPNSKHRNKKWFDADLVKMRKNLINNAKHFAKQPKDPFVRGRFFKLRKAYAKLCKFKRKQFKISMLQKIDALHQNNPQEYWNLIREISNNKSLDNGNAIPPSCWLSHFIGLNTVRNSFKQRISFLEDQVSKLETQTCFNELDFKFSESEISKAISRLKCNKSPGIDRISNHMLKFGQHSLLPSLKKLFNCCLISGKYPSQWTTGLVTVLHKSGDISDPNNYRGITITNTIGKLFNSILNAR
jgi:hypothetical protein